MKRAVNELSAAHHPYDLATGGIQRADEVATRFGDTFAETDEIAGRPGLSDKPLAAIGKA